MIEELLLSANILSSPSKLSQHTMKHIVLLGDSIFDNGHYTMGGPDVISQVRQLLPAGWQASLLAVDGSTTEDVPSQLHRMPPDASHLAEILEYRYKGSLSPEPAKGESMLVQSAVL